MLAAPANAKVVFGGIKKAVFVVSSFQYFQVEKKKR